MHANQQFLQNFGSDLQELSKQEANVIFSLGERGGVFPRTARADCL